MRSGKQPERDSFTQMMRDLHRYRQITSRNNLKQIGLGFHNHHDVYAKFPGSTNHKIGKRDTQPFSWRVAILPYVEHPDLYQQYRFDEPWDSEANLKLLKQMPECYRSSSASEDVPLGHTRYQGFATEASALGPADGVAIREIRDGTSNTVLVVESAESVPWTKPQDLDEIPKSVEGRPIHLLLADASVLTKLEIDPSLWKKLITRDGGETIEW
jgi:hypothetical protein